MASSHDSRVLYARPSEFILTGKGTLTLSLLRKSYSAQQGTGILFTRIIRRFEYKTGLGKCCTKNRSLSLCPLSPGTCVHGNED